MTGVSSGRTSVLTDDLYRGLISVGEVDLLVGVLTHNNARRSEKRYKLFELDS